jgi:hypothetical protein
MVWPKRDVVAHTRAIHSERGRRYSVVEQHLGEG